MTVLYNQPYDRNGAKAKTGQVLQPVVDKLLREKFFLKPPPKSAGREQYGQHYAAQFLRLCRLHSSKPENTIATATALTAASIQKAFDLFITPKLLPLPTDLILSGGGAKNSTLTEMLRERLPDCKLTTSDDHSLPAQSKEAAAFALLAWLTWHHHPGNLPTATGAARPAILGRITYV